MSEETLNEELFTSEQELNDHGFHIVNPDDEAPLSPKDSLTAAYFE